MKMTKTIWLAKVLAHREPLLALIRDYHPQSPQAGRKPLPITAPNAEATRVALIESGNVTRAQLFPPVERFDRALGAKRVKELSELFDETWMGVPESDACWVIPGFRQLVDLMEDYQELS